MALDPLPCSILAKTLAQTWLFVTPLWPSLTLIITCSSLRASCPAVIFRFSDPFLVFLSAKNLKYYWAARVRYMLPFEAPSPLSCPATEYESSGSYRKHVINIPPSLVKKTIKSEALASIYARCQVNMAWAARVSTVQRPKPISAISSGTVLAKKKKPPFLMFLFPHTLHGTAAHLIPFIIYGNGHPRPF